MKKGKKRLGIIILVIGTKGGPGKTTLVQNILVGLKLANSSYKVLGLDVDINQPSLLNWHNRRVEYNCNSGENQIDVKQLTVEESSNVSDYMDDYDYIVIDFPGHTGEAFDNLAMIGDCCITPINPSSKCLETLPEINESIEATNNLIKLNAEEYALEKAQELAVSKTEKEVAALEKANSTKVSDEEWERIAKEHLDIILKNQKVEYQKVKSFSVMSITSPNPFCERTRDFKEMVGETFKNFPPLKNNISYRENVVWSDEAGQGILEWSDKQNHKGQKEIKAVIAEILTISIN